MTPSHEMRGNPQKRQKNQSKNSASRQLSKSDLENRQPNVKAKKNDFAKQPKATKRVLWSTIEGVSDVLLLTEPKHKGSKEIKEEKNKAGRE